MNLFNLFATLTLDTGDFEKKISGIENGASDLSSELKSSFSRGEKSVDDFSDKVDDMQSDVGKNLDKTENDTEDFRKEIDKEFEKSEDAVEDFSDKVDDMQSDVGKNLDKTENDTEDFRKEIDKEFEKSEDAVEDFSDSVDDMADKYKKNTDNVGKNSSSFSSKLGGALKTGVSAVAGFTTAIAGAATAVAGLATQTIDYAGDLDDNATRVSMSTEAYQTWAFAMQLAGTDVSTLQTAVRSLTMFTSNLTAGNEDAAEALDDLGLSYEDFIDLPMEEQLNAVVNALQGMEDQTLMVQTAQDVFGSRAYQQLLPLLTQEKGYIDDLSASMTEMGMIMSDDAIKAGAALGDQLDLLKKRITMVGNSMLSDLFPEMELIMEGLNGLASGSDDAMQSLSDGLVGLIDKVTTALPDIISTATDLLMNVITGLIQAIAKPEVIQNIVDLIESLLISVVQLLPTLTQSLMDIAVALFDALLHLDWGTLIVELLTAFIDIVLIQLPQMLTDMVFSLIDAVFDLFFTQDGQKALADFGISLAEAIINGLIGAVESGLNSMIDLINGMLDGLSNVWTWTGLPEIPDIPYAHFGRVDFAEGGMFPEDMGTLYALAGESGAEIVARGSRGTGVANVEQIADAQYMAMQDYDLRGAIQQAAAAIVNGIVDGLSSTEQGSENTPIIVRIGDKDFSGYIVNTVNSTLRAQGRKSLRTVTAY